MKKPVPCAIGKYNSHHDPKTGRFISGGGGVARSQKRRVPLDRPELSRGFSGVEGVGPYKVRPAGPGVRGIEYTNPTGVRQMGQAAANRRYDTQGHNLSRGVRTQPRPLTSGQITSMQKPKLGETVSIAGIRSRGPQADALSAKHGYKIPTGKITQIYTGPNPHTGTRELRVQVKWGRNDKSFHSAHDIIRG